MAKRYKLNKIKGLATYKVEEIVEVLGVHRRTVQQWFQDGLPRIDNHKPFLTFGSDLKAFLRKKMRRRKRKCGPGELYCVKCRLPRHPKDRIVKIEPMNEKKAIMTGICSSCGRPLNQFVAIKNLPQIAKMFVISGKRDKDLIESRDSTPNTDIQQELFE
jgi:hypothetical protein